MGNQTTRSITSTISPEDCSSSTTPQLALRLRTLDIFWQLNGLHIQVAIYFDFVLGDIYVSEDEGFSWNRAADIPKGEVQMVYEHPFNNRYVSTSSRL
jgi:hypothetical protein